MMNTIVERQPDRKFTLTGVPSLAEKLPMIAGRPVVAGHGLTAVGAHQPRARTRDERQDEPHGGDLVIVLAAPPYTPLNTVATASRKAETPLPLMSVGGITEMIASTAGRTAGSR